MQHTTHGVQLNAVATEKARPSLAGIVSTAVRRAWGDSVLSSCRFAVRTEKCESATHNLLVLTLKSDCGPVHLDEDRLRRELPAFVALLAPPRVIAQGAQDVWRSVRKQTHAVLVPYSALLPPDSKSIEDTKGSVTTAAAADPAADPTAEADDCRTLWLSGLPSDCAAADVASLIGEVMGDTVYGVGGTGGADGIGWRVTMPTCGGFADIFHLNGAALARALDALDGRLWRGSRLIALRGKEARAKLLVHQKIKHVLRSLAAAKHFRNFVDPKGINSAGSAQRKLQHCSSGVHTDVRAAMGARGICTGDDVGGSCKVEGKTAEDAWRRHDWVEIRFCAREFGAQQLRRMAGVLIAYVRGVEGDDYLERCTCTRQHVTTPLAPAEATWLAGYGLEAKAAEAYCGIALSDPNVVAGAGMGGGGLGGLGGSMGPVSTAGAGDEASSANHGTDDDVVVGDVVKNGGGLEHMNSVSASGATASRAEAAFEAKLRAAVMSASAAPFAALVRSLDGGDATRAQDDAKLRDAALAGDVVLVAECLDVGVARLDATDEYGRSPLFLAASNGKLSVVTALLERGARTSQAAHGGWTPLVAARVCGHAEIAALLAAAVEKASCQHSSPRPVLMKALALRTARLPGELASSTHDDDLATAIAAAARDEAARTPPVLSFLVPPTLEGHPGAGTLSIEHALPESCVDAILQLWRSLPTAPKDKPSPIDRSYYADVDGWLCAAIDNALVGLGIMSPTAGVELAKTAGADGGDEGKKGVGTGAGTQPLMRFLHYPTVGGYLPAHVDLPRVTSDGTRTTHTFLLYLTDCAEGGETLLLDARPGDAKLAPAGGVAPGARATISACAPRKGRLMLMPHACPHSAAPVESVPKLLIRGEVLVVPP